MRKSPPFLINRWRGGGFEIETLGLAVSIEFQDAALSPAAII